MGPSDVEVAAQRLRVRDDLGGDEGPAHQRAHHKPEVHRQHHLGEHDGAFRGVKVGGHITPADAR